MRNRAILATAMWQALIPPRRPAVARLARLEAAIAAAYPAVDHLTPAALAGLQADGAAPVVLDVRGSEEVAAGTLPDAFDLLSAEVAVARAVAAGQPLVVACSVGLRSARWIAAYGEGGGRSTSLRLYNLSGGIFRWHNERRPLRAAGGGAGEAHPYGFLWGRFLDRPARGGT